MSMKRVVKAIEAIERRIHTVGTNVEARAYGAVVLMLRDAIAPDWKPASEPPDTSRYVWVITASRETTMATYSGAAGVWVHWSTGAVLEGVNAVVKWNEIEVPERPEVGT